MTQSDSDYWTYRAKIERVVDGDTIDLKVDLGFRTYKNVRVRLSGVDTAETYGIAKESEEYALGKEQTAFVKEFLSTDDEWDITFYSNGEKGSFGRWMGDVSVNGEKLTEALITEWPDVKVE